MRQAIRHLGARPGFSAVVLIILAVGVGANTAAFSIVRGMLLQPLPYPDSENIVAVGHSPPFNAEAFPYLLGSELLQLQADARSFEQITGYWRSSAAIMTPDGTANLRGMEVTPSFFPLLRAVPHAGRLFNEADAIEGAQGVVLLSYSAWVTWFAADEDIVGAPVELDTDPHIVIGVLTDGFEFEDADFWTPLVVETGEPVDGMAREVSYSVIGRLQSGVSPGQALAEVRTLLARSARMRPPSLSLLTHVTPLQEQRGRPFHAALLMFTTATGLVLLMTCANVAGLLLARGMVRAPELGIRGALGASRSRIVRQLLTECVVLGVIGGSAGLALAVGIIRIAPAIGAHVPRLADVGVDLPVLAFAAGLSVITGLLFGSAPAIASSRVDLARIMNDAHASTASLGRANGQALLVAGQVAIALVFLISAGLLLRSFVAHITFDPGFDPAHIVSSIPIDPSSDTRSSPGYTEALMTQMDRISSVPDVEAVALAWPLPLDPAASTPIAVAGRPASNLEAGVRRVTPSYAETLRLRLLEGRFFTERDTEGSPPVAVVSESFAREAFGAEPAVGQQLLQPTGPSLPGRDPIGGGSWEVIGVVADVSSPFLQTHPLFPSVNDIYLSMRQPRMESVIGVLLQRVELTGVLVRTSGDPTTAIPFIREVLSEVAPGATVNLVDMIETRLSNAAAQPRFYALCAGLFGLVALVLAAIGIYSLLSYAVSQRRREIGVRMALGADRRDVVMLVFRQGGILICVGVIIGLLAAVAATRILGSILFDVTPADPLTFTAGTALLLTVALVACWLPARQATRIAPMDVLKGN